MAQGVSVDDVRAAFLQFDHNGSGAIDWKEFKAMLLEVLRPRWRWRTLIGSLADWPMGRLAAWLTGNLADWLIG